MSFGQIKQQYEKIISHNYVNIEMYRKLRHLAGKKKNKNKTQNQNQQNTMLFFFFSMKGKTSYLGLTSLLNEIEKNEK